MPADAAGVAHTSASFSTRAGAADLLSAANEAQSALVDITIATTCTEREDARAIIANAAKSETAATALDATVTELLAEYSVFQTGEAARIAAEIEAARVAAEAEEARVAAEAAEAAEAARIAAEQAAADDDDSGYSGGGGSSSGGGSGYHGSSGTPGGGGGGLDFGPDKGGCWTSNGMGGLAAC